MLKKEDATRTIAGSKTQPGRRFVFPCIVCACEIFVRSGALKKHSGTCGSCNNKKTKNTLPPYVWLYNRLLREAAKRDISVDLTFEQFLLLTDIECCRYCGKRINWYKHSRKGGAGANLDRNDNSKGYSVDNVCVCCYTCNTRKSNWLNSDEFQAINDFLRLYRKLPDNRELMNTILCWEMFDVVEGQKK